MVIAVDASGGDFYPGHPVQGAMEALQELPDIEIVLTGPEKIIREELKKYSWDKDRLHILDAPEVIGMDETPSVAVKQKRNSSIVKGLGAHREKRCQAFVSTGNTGALLAASIFILGKLEGVQRPTIAAVLPTLKSNALLIDAGANLQLKTEHYYQFAKMGAIYSREIFGKKNPETGLLNVGEEPGKGTDLLKEVYLKLEELPGFAGNIEGKDIFEGRVDVILSDGLIGNIVLKFGESIPGVFQKLLSRTMKELDLKREEREMVIDLFQKTVSPFNYENVGGIPFLGVNGVSVVGHGGSSPLAIKNMIVNAARYVKQDVNGKIVKALGQTVTAD